MIKLQNEIFLMLFAALAASGVFAATASAAQNVPAHAANNQVNLIDVAQPDLKGVDPQVQEQIHAAQAALTAALAQADASSVRRAEAFGNLGQIYQAYSFSNAASNCYRNAARLDPQSFRWSYYAGYLGQQYGDAETAEHDYQHALTLNPHNVPALLRLGTLELTLDRSDAAKQYFTRAAAQPTPSAAALTDLGKVALLDRQYDVALKYFTQALALEPQATSIHYQLAMTYRGMGDVAHMKEQLDARGDVEPAIHDPLLDEIDVLRQGKFSLLERGNTAMRENRFADAVEAYRQMIGLTPSSPIAYKYLGVALARSGNSDQALEAYAHALALDPGNATVHYNMGILLTEAGKEDQAIAHFEQAIKLDPGLVTAHFQLANLLMRKTDDAGAEREYGLVVSLEPQNAFAPLMQAMAAVHAGAYHRARTLLERAAASFPRDPAIANALARVLAAAPDPAVRDQSRALSIVQNLVSHQQGDPLEVGITLAMALAAAGRFQQAAGYQEAIIKQLEDSQELDLARRLRPDLARYQQDKPCRLPWAADDPIFTPVPSTAQLSTHTKAAIANP